MIDWVDLGMCVGGKSIRPSTQSKPPKPPNQVTTHPHGVPDMAKLDHLHEASLLHNLARRHAASLPYTATGPIVLAVNPYRWLDGLYGEAEAGRCVLFGSFRLEGRNGADSFRFPFVVNRTP